jgi:hypothetical protein
MGSWGLNKAQHPLFDYWVAHSEGFQVEAGSKRIGFVEDTLIDHLGTGVSVLAIRGGVLGRRLALVHSDDVIVIVPRARRILLRSRQLNPETPRLTQLRSAEDIP